MLQALGNYNNLVNPALTDLYQLTTVYAHWKNGRHNDHAVFDQFFRTCPFKGEFAIFGGLAEVLRFLVDFRFTEAQIKYLQHGQVVSKEEQQRRFDELLERGLIRQTSAGGYEYHAFIDPRSMEQQWLPIARPDQDLIVEAPLGDCEPEFFDYLRTLDASEVKVHALDEGTVCFPRVPQLRYSGPLAVLQLIETTSLNQINFPSLVTTNAVRLRQAAGWDKIMLEFGLRRAQGADGAMAASLYSYQGTFNGTSNVQAGQLFGIPIKGTHPHAFIQAYKSLADLRVTTIVTPQGETVEFLDRVLHYRQELGFTNTNQGELAAMIAYAQAFPSKFLALVDTYDTLKSGVPNFLCVASALAEIGYRPLGIRLDSGDLAYLSKESRSMFAQVGAKVGHDYFVEMMIAASNDINEVTLYSLAEQGHEINIFGIGTNQVTCQAQPAFGGVFKLVSINGIACIKLSEQLIKVTISGAKLAYRLIGKDGKAICDLMILEDEEPPPPGQPVLCRHPFIENKRIMVRPTAVIPLLRLVWDGQLVSPHPSPRQIRDRIRPNLELIRDDHLRRTNPTPYKVSVSDRLYQMLHELWMDGAPIAVIE